MVAADSPVREQWGLSPATLADLQEIADTPDYWGIGPEGGLWVYPERRDDSRSGTSDPVMAGSGAIAAGPGVGGSDSG